MFRSHEEVDSVIIKIYLLLLVVVFSLDEDRHNGLFIINIKSPKPEYPSSIFGKV